MARKTKPSVPAHDGSIHLNANQMNRLLFGVLVEKRVLVTPQWPTEDTYPSEHSKQPGYWLPYTADGRLRNSCVGTNPDDCGIYAPFKAGDVLWIREPWRLTLGFYPPPALNAITFEGGAMPPYPITETAAYTAAMQAFRQGCELYPVHRFMPGDLLQEAFARPVRVQVENVFMERLQTMGESGARTEGFGSYTHATMGYIPGPYQFASVWNGRHGEGARWSDNPWAWTLTLRPVLSAPGAPPVPVVFEGWPPLDPIRATADVTKFMARAAAEPGMTDAALDGYVVTYVRLLALQIRAFGDAAVARAIESQTPDSWRRAFEVAQKAVSP